MLPSKPCAQVSAHVLENARRGEQFFGRENCASRRHTELFLSNLKERYLQVGLQGALVREEHRGGGLTEGCAAVRVSAASAGVEALARGGGGEQESGLRAC